MAAISRSAPVCLAQGNVRGPECARAHKNRAAAAIALALCLVFAAVAVADERDDTEKLKVFRDLNPDNRAASDRRVEFHTGYVELRYFGMNWRIFYLPLLAPLPGARLEDEAKIPNPFELTGTPYATTMPPMFDHDRSREVEREYKRIEKLTRVEVREK